MSSKWAKPQLEMWGRSQQSWRLSGVLAPGLLQSNRNQLPPRPGPRAPHSRAGHPTAGQYRGTQGPQAVGPPRECTWVAEDAGLSLLQPWHQSSILPGWCSQFQEQPVLSAGGRHLPFSMTNNRQKLPPLSQARSLPTR